MLVALGAAAQTNPTVKGTIEIDYRTRRDTTPDGKVKPGVSDLYKMNITVANRAQFAGSVSHLPMLSGVVFGTAQEGSLHYNLNASVVNPNPPHQSKTVGRLTGTVPIDRSGTYQFSDGTLRMGIDASGNARGFEGKFLGKAIGKPPKKDSLFDKAAKQAKQAINVTKEIGGKKVTIVVRDYDKMVFSGHVLATGPVQSYPDAQVNGEMLYDYERLAWYFQGVTILYSVDGKTITDKLTGNIRWVESPQRKSNGEGEYQFDVRVNEPEQKSTEDAVFAKASDEGAFFEANPNIAALVGTMKYKDAFSGDTVTQSAVTIDLAGNNLNRQQVMNLTKLLLISCVVPMNAE